jgi:hypothetical protein
MKKATRHFLKMKNIPEHMVVNVKQQPSKQSKHNECHDNAILENETTGSWVVPGWLITEYIPGQGTWITPHSWNATKEGNDHYDTTPFRSFKDDPSIKEEYWGYEQDPSKYEYVIDQSIVEEIASGEAEGFILSIDQDKVA